jgi:hypothetical protein
VEVGEYVSTAFSDRCRHLRHVDGYFCLNVGVLTELVVKINLDTSDYVFVGFRLTAE